jgi:hypothetical protein
VAFNLDKLSWKWVTVNMSKTSSFILVGMAALALIVILGLRGKNVGAEKTEETSLRPVAVALAELTPISNTATLSGEFRPVQEVDVHAKVAGYIRKIYLDVGDHVQTGQTLAILEVPELDAQLQGADAAIRRSKDAVRRAKGDLDRALATSNNTGIIATEMRRSVERGSEKARKANYFILPLSLFVFLFALHAKVSLYHQSGPAHSNARSKLWLNEQKIELGTSVENSKNILTGIFAVLLFFSSPLLRSSRSVDLPSTPANFSTDLFAVCRFPRPPPTF